MIGRRQMVYKTELGFLEPIVLRGQLLCYPKQMQQIANNRLRYRHQEGSGKIEKVQRLNKGEDKSSCKDVKDGD